MKKLLLVAVSVGVFLLVTVTVSLAVLKPKAQIQESAFTSSVPLTNLRQTSDITNNIPQPEIVDIPLVTNGDERTEVTIHIPTPSSAAIPEAPADTAITAGTPAAATVTAATAVTTQPTATRSASTTPAASQTSTAAARPAPARTVNDYWVQTGAFSAMVRAEDARDQLASRGLVSIIENREINGRIWYRVRLGPYTTEREANHWLAIVKEISGFGESQVRQTVRQQ
ncbi:MAG: SPOR domain-containing protein [Treponema sp.]|nr:SPOR domain-containing protein [Treponema sp.]